MNFIKKCKQNISPNKRMVLFYLGFVVLLVLIYWTLSIEGSPRNVPVRTPFGSDTVALSWFMTGIIYWLSLLLIFYGILLVDKDIGILVVLFLLIGPHLYLIGLEYGLSGGNVLKMLSKYFYMYILGRLFWG